jgi:hypothetical protein
LPKYLFHTPQGSLTCSKYCDIRLTALLLQRESCYGFLSPLKIHLSRTGLNPRTLGSQANTVTTTLQVTTFWNLRHLKIVITARLQVLWSSSYNSNCRVMLALSHSCDIIYTAYLTAKSLYIWSCKAESWFSGVSSLNINDIFTAVTTSVLRQNILFIDAVSSLNYTP